MYSSPNSGVSSISGEFVSDQPLMGRGLDGICRQSLVADSMKGNERLICVGRVKRAAEHRFPTGAV